MLLPTSSDAFSLEKTLKPTLLLQKKKKTIVNQK
jgi:hypothetical protein